MKSTGKIIVAAFLFLIVLVWTSDSEARSGHQRSRGHHFGQARQHRVGKHQSRHRYYRHGHKSRVKRGHRYYRPKPRVKYGHYGRRHGIYRGYGHRYRGYYGYYGRYGYGHKRYYPYPYRYGYYYKSYGKSHYYDIGYPDDYQVESYYSANENAGAGYANGWNLLRTGRPAEAADVFGQLAQENPAKGNPKIGYAVAAAELGDLDKGIWSMRRALRSDPEALRYVAVDDQLRPKVERVVRRYEQSPRYQREDPGGSFMLAALYYLMGDLDAAQGAIKRNLSSDDTSTSAENLKRLIAEESQAE